MEARSKWETYAMKTKASDGGLKKEAAEAEAEAEEEREQTSSFPGRQM